MTSNKRRFRFTSRSHQDLQADIKDEFAFHLDTRVSELMANGMSEPQARAKALAEFGDLDAGIRGCVTTGAAVERQRWLVRTASELVQDLKYGSV